MSTTSRELGEILSFTPNDYNILNVLREECQQICQGKISNDYFESVLRDFEIGFLLKPRNEDTIYSFILYQKLNNVQFISLLCSRPGFEYGSFLLRYSMNQAKEAGYLQVGVSLDRNEGNLLQYFRNHGFYIANTVYQYDLGTGHNTDIPEKWELLRDL